MGQRESKVERLLVEGARELGGMALKFISPGRAGVPDRLVVLPNGVVHFVELKADGGALSKQQERMIAKLREIGQTVLVLYGEQEVRHYLDNLRELMNGAV